MKREFGYKLLKPLVIGKFLLKYKPIIIGKSNIPKTGPIVVCGNHRHKDDQYNMMAVTNRVVHMLAKEEYFEGNMAWFYRFVGCIKVDRRVHDENAKNEAIGILEEDGAIGLFPEGTRNEITCKSEKLDEVYAYLKDKMSLNQLKDSYNNKCVRFTQTEKLISLFENNKITLLDLKEYLLDPDTSLLKLVNDKLISKTEYNDSLLLPLKYGAVSFAQKSNALIVPFATTGTYTGKKGSLTTKIGKPFSVQGLTLVEANELLKENIIKLMK